MFTVYLACGPFHKRVFNRNSDSVEIWFGSNSILGHYIYRKFCTCHNSTNVVPFVTFHDNHLNTTWMGAEWNVHRIWVIMEISFPSCWWFVTSSRLYGVTVRGDFIPGSRVHHSNGPLTRYAKLRLAHAPGMPAMFSPPPWVSDPAASRHARDARAVMHAEIAYWRCFLWSRWRGKRSRHSRRMHYPQFHVSVKRLIMRTVPGCCVLLWSGTSHFSIFSRFTLPALRQPVAPFTNMV